MVQLAEVYKLEKINKYFAENSRPERLLEAQKCGKFKTEGNLKRKRCKLEYKLLPE